MDWLNLQYLGITLKKTFVDMFFWKFFLGITTAVAGYFFDVNLFSQIQRVAVLVVFRFLIGWVASYKRGEGFEEPKAIASIVKLGLYSLCISAAHNTEQAISAPMNLLLDESIIGIIAAAELISILKTAQGLGVPVPKMIFKKLDEIAKK